MQMMPGPAWCNTLFCVGKPLGSFKAALLEAMMQDLGLFMLFIDFSEHLQAALKKPICNAAL